MKIIQILPILLIISVLVISGCAQKGSEPSSSSPAKTATTQSAKTSTAIPAVKPVVTKDTQIDLVYENSNAPPHPHTHKVEVATTGDIKVTDSLSGNSTKKITRDDLEKLAQQLIGQGFFEFDGSSREGLGEEQIYYIKLKVGQHEKTFYAAPYTEKLKEQQKKFESFSKILEIVGIIKQKGTSEL